MALAQARLSLDGTHLPIVARVERSSEEGLVVGRSLPFLRLGTKVRDQDGRSGSIARVSMSVEDGVPYLSVELDYEPIEAPKEPPPPAVRARRDETLSYEMRGLGERVSRPSIAPPPRRDETNHDGTLDLALSTTAPMPIAPERFVPSLHPMPLPLPEPRPALARAPWRQRALAFLTTLTTLLFT